MIALRPFHFKINKMSFEIKEGRLISGQVLELMKADKMKKDGLMVDTLDEYNKIKADEKAREKEDIKKGEKERQKIIDKRNKKPVDNSKKEGNKR